MQSLRIDAKRHHIAAMALLLSTLSERERDVMFDVCKGDNTPEIADRRKVAVNTIERQRAIILRKLASRNSTQMAHVLKSAEAYHLRRYIYRLQIAKKHPQTQLGVLRLLPEDGTAYQSISTVAMEPMLGRINPRRIGNF